MPKIGVMYRLWDLSRSHGLRMMLFALVAVPKNAAGNSLLYVEVSHIDINKYIAHAMNYPLVALIGFITSIIIWWSRGIPIRQAGKKFTKVELFMFGAGQCVFAVLTAGLGVQYMQASIFNMVVLGVVHYTLIDKRVFVQEKIAIA